MATALTASATMEGTAAGVGLPGAPEPLALVQVVSAPARPPAPTRRRSPARRSRPDGLVAAAIRDSGLDATAAYRPGPAPAHLPALDGLRALAITLVVAFHLGLHWASGGFVGVDVFFVLSGFLITGLLVQEQHGTGAVGFRHFWARRARRLLPALCLLLVVLAVVAVANPRVVSPTTLRTDGLATLFYVQNWHLVLQSHTAQLAEIFTPSPLLHTWSLAIEEQFYLLWPLVVFLALRRVRGRAPRRRRLWAVVVVGAVASMGVMAGMSLAGSAPLSIYYDSGTRAFELLIGAGLALLLPLPASGAGDRPLRRPAPWWAGILGLLALAVIVAAADMIPGIGAAWLYRGGLLAIALTAAVAIWAAVRAPRSLAGRLLASPPAVALGRISYGVYLWHWPILVMVTPWHTGIHGGALIALQLTLTLAAALASWTLVERPVRRLVTRRMAQPRMAQPRMAQPTVAMPPSTGMTAPVR